MVGGVWDWGRERRLPRSPAAVVRLVHSDGVFETLEIPEVLPAVRVAPALGTIVWLRGVDMGLVMLHAALKRPSEPQARRPANAVPGRSQAGWLTRFREGERPDQSTMTFVVRSPPPARSLAR
jgi:hypothetical protein